MNKYSITIIASLLEELKQTPTADITEKLKSILANEISSYPCAGIVINNSTRADAFYGMIVYPKIIISKETKGMVIKSYVIEIQKKLLDILTGKQLAAYLIHDLSHNVLTSTVIERLKAAIYNVCKMTDTKVIDIMYNMDSKMRDIAVMDIANRTYKEMVVPGTEMYEGDRILVDNDIWKDYNLALNAIGLEIDTFNLSDSDNQNIADDYIATKIVKMVREKYRGIVRTYTWLKDYVTRTYDTKVFDIYPTIDIEMKEELFGQKVSEIEELKPYELQMLREDTIEFLKSKNGLQEASYLIESIFKPKRPNVVSLQKELDVITFKLQNISSNYERLALLDRIYDTIYILEKYLEEYPTDETMKSFLDKFLALPQILRDVKPAKRQYGVFVEYPAGYTD